MNILRLHRTLWLLLFLAVLPAAAQEYAFRTFTVHDGLISNYVTTLEQDSRGYLWIGTDEGFSIYDGHHFMNVHPPEGMVWGYVNRFLELPSSPGTMLIATNGSGIVRYDGNFSAPLLLDSIESSNRVNDLYEDETGTLWCATDNGLYRVRNGVPQRIAVPSLSARALIQISSASSGTAWITSPTALLSVDLRTDRVRVVLRTNIEGTNDQIVPMPDGEHTVMTTRNALLLFRKDSIVQRLEFREGEYGNTILDTNGDLWIGGTKRVVRARLRRGKLIVLGDYDRGNGVPVNDVSCLKGDRENNLWFGTPGKGLVRLHDHENFLLRFNGSTSRGTAESRSGLWMPTLSGLYNISGDTPGALQQRRFTFRQDLLPIAVQVSSNGLLWCTTYGEGLSVYRMKLSNGRVTALEPVRHWRRSNLFPGVYTTILFLDSRQRLWCSTDSGGVMIVDTRHPGSSPRLLDRFPGTEDLNIAAFAETPDGRVLAGGNGSPVLLEFAEEQGRMQVHRVHRFGDSISNAGIRSLAVTQEGSMWIGTRYDGLLRRRPDGTVRKYGYADGLHSQQILSLFVDGNALWIGTQSGMEYVPDIAAPRFIRSTELTGSPVYTIGRFSGASVWGMTRYEVVVNDPQALTIPKITPPLYLTSFLVNGIPQGDEE
ncbi:MAG: hypothetical protein KBF97_04570, partial [Bacteroidetes bacterium]|nr:hypothetical protein [Bacteroidota bacterium]